MGTVGTIGNIDAKFTASTGDFTASMEGIGSSVGQMAAKVKSAGESTAASVGKMTAASEKARYAAMMAGDAAEASVGKMTTAHERAARAWQREKTQQDLATDSLQAAARAEEMAALKADILARSTEKLGLSTNGVVAKFQLMSREVSASMGSMGEKIAATAEKAELSADGIAAGFGGLGKLLGVGILGELAAHTLDDIAEMNVKIGDLHEKTGIAVQSLAGLQLAAQSKGLDFTTISTGMVRLGKAMYEAKQGMLEDREAFSALGISMQEVNSLSVEQMFYRISKAIGENTSLVVSDGTAMQLFSRGGKEIVPMLREWGGNLEQVAKQQGALTGVTDQSVAASQKWLQTTSDLSAEFHAGMTPILVELVKHMGSLEAIMRGLDIVSVLVFGTMVNGLLTVTEGVAGLGKALLDLHNGDYALGFEDLKDMRHDLGAAWAAEGHSVAADWRAMKGDWAESGSLPPNEKVLDQNQEGGVDGALLKSAKQQLATMEQKHPLTHAQLQAFWKQQLARAKPGSTDYEQVNLMLGNLAQHPGGQSADQKQMEGFQQGLADMKNAHEVSVAEEYEYWAKKRAALTAGSRNYVRVSKEMGNLYQSVMKDQDALNAQASGGHGLMILPRQFTGYFGQAAAEPTQPGPESSISEEDTSRIKSQSSEQAGYLKNLNEGIAIRQKSADQMAELAIKMAVARGEMSKMQAVEATAALHATQYSEALDKLQASLAFIAGISGLSPSDRNAQSAPIQNQIDALNGSRAAQIVEDSASVNEDTLGGSVRRAMNLYVQQATDTAAQISEILTSAFESVNSSLSRSLMAHAYNGREYRRNIEEGLSVTARGIGSQVLDSGMKQIEGGVLGHFGFGSKAKPDGSQANPLWVRLAQQLAGGGAGIPGVGAIANAFNPSGLQTSSESGKSGLGTMISSVVSTGLHLLPGFADGGSISSNMPAIVGENGPELFMPASSGRVIPNGQFGSGGGATTHNISIDARGATDPAQTEAAVHRAMRQYLPQAIAGAMSAIKEDRMRRAPSAH